MAIVSQVVVRARHDAQNMRVLLPKRDNNGEIIVTPPAEVQEPSHSFTVQTQPAIIVAGGFVPRPSDLYAVDEIAIEVSPDDGTTWQQLWIHGKQAKLTPTNSMVYLPIPGVYRVQRLNTGVFDEEFETPLIPGSSIVSQYYGTLSHEAALTLLPWHTQGIEGAAGAPGTIPALRIHTYTYEPTITVETDLYDIVDITMAGPLVLFFSGGLDGKKTHLRLRQDPSGSRPVTFSGVRAGPDIAAAAFVSSTPLALDHVMVTYTAADNIYDLIAINHGFM